MKKRKINPEYLRHITSTKLKEENIDAGEFSKTIKNFAQEYLFGILTVSIRGESRGNIKANLPVVSYLIRLFAEMSDESAPSEVNISLSDEFAMSVSFNALPDIESTAYMVKMAKLAGFTVERQANTFTFKTQIQIVTMLQIYAVSVDDFMKMLITTHKM